MNSRERGRKADYPRSVGGRFKKQGIYIGGLSWVAQTTRSPHPSARIVKDYTKAVTGYNHVPNPESLTTHYFFKATAYR